MTALFVSRRHVLALAGLTLGAATIELAVGADPAHAASAEDLALVPIADKPVALLSGDGAATTQLPRQLAVRVARTIPLSAGAKLTITFDPRAYAPLSPAVIVHDGRPIAAEKTLVVDPATGLQTVVIVLAESVPASGTLVVVAATANSRLYPYDLVRRPVAPTAGLRRSPRAAQLRRPLSARQPSSGRPVEPWGIELDGVWTEVRHGDDPLYRYHLPARISVRSVGPGAAPASSFAVHVDPRMVRRLSIGAAWLNHRPYHGRVRLVGSAVTASAYETRWALPVALAADDVLDLEVAAETTVPRRALADVTHPLVSILPGGHAAGQRRTGKESLTRIDSSWGERLPG